MPTLRNIAILAVPLAALALAVYRVSLLYGWFGPGVISEADVGYICDCATLPCVFDQSCNDPRRDRLGGLGCRAEGKHLCRFEIMQCDMVKHMKRMCFEDAENCPGGLGCLTEEFCNRPNNDGCDYKNGGGNPHLRYCGFGKFASVPCPRGAVPTEANEHGVPPEAAWLWGEPSNDLHPKCEEWARGGDCQSNSGYMDVHCRLACDRLKEKSEL